VQLVDDALLQTRPLSRSNSSDLLLRKHTRTKRCVRKAHKKHVKEPSPRTGQARSGRWSPRSPPSVFSCNLSCIYTALAGARATTAAIPRNRHVPIRIEATTSVSGRPTLRADASLLVTLRAKMDAERVSLKSQEVTEPYTARRQHARDSSYVQCSAHIRIQW